jgi:hypothetical protein
MYIGDITRYIALFELLYFLFHFTHLVIREIIRVAERLCRKWYSWRKTKMFWQTALHNFLQCCRFFASTLVIALHIDKWTLCCIYFLQAITTREIDLIEGSIRLTLEGAHKAVQINTKVQPASFAELITSNFNKEWFRLWFTDSVRKHDSTFCLCYPFKYLGSVGDD